MSVFEPSGHVRIDRRLYGDDTMEAVRHTFSLRGLEIEAMKNTLMHSIASKAYREYYNWLEAQCLEAITRDCDLAVWENPLTDPACGGEIDTVNNVVTFTWKHKFVPVSDTAHMISHPHDVWPEYANATIIFLHDLAAIAALSGEDIPQATEAWIKDVQC